MSLLSLALQNRHEHRRTNRELRRRAVELLIAGDHRTARIVLGATSATRRGRTLPNRLRMVRAHGAVDDLEDALAALEERPVIAAVLGEELVVVCTPRLATDVATQLLDRRLCAGIGRAVTADRAQVSHDTAGHALAATTPRIPVHSWEDLAGSGVVGLLGVDQARAFSQTYLAPLQDPLLRLTLEAFLRHHGSRANVAAELGVHRNTVRNRIVQIESALGESLDDPRVRVDAWVAVELNRIGGGAEGE